jgi:hypothetical protein
MRSRRLLSLAAASVLVVAQVAGVAPAVAVTAADAPNTCGGATTAKPLSTWLVDAIEPAGDVDWYRFTTTSSRYALITVGKLAANYRLDVYASCSGSPVASSNRSGKQYEELYKKLAAGTYFVKVSGVSGAHSPTTYQVRFRSLPDAVMVLSYRTWIDTGKLFIAGELLNGTSQTRMYVKALLTLYDASNHQLGLVNYTFGHIRPMKARTRTPFGPVYVTLPAGYDHYKVSADPGSVPTEGPVGSLTLKAATPYDTSWNRHYPGTLTNGNAFALTNSKVAITLYDSSGRVLQAGYTYPGAVPGHGTVNFDVMVWDHYTGVNRVTYLVHGDD